MSSLYSTSLLAIVRLIVVKKKSNKCWFETFNTSFIPTNIILTIWLVAITFSTPPLVGFGDYDQSMVGVRYNSIQLTQNKYIILF